MSQENNQSKAIIDVEMIEVHETHRIWIQGHNIQGDLSRCTVTSLGEVWIGRLGVDTVFGFTSEEAIQKLASLPPSLKNQKWNSLFGSEPVA